MARAKTRRLFFALWPDEGVRRYLQQLQKTLDLTAGGRLLHKADLHITLQYLGQVREEQLDCVSAAASRVAVCPFRLEIAGVSHWRRSRVVWAGLAGIPDELRELVHQLGEQLTPCGFPPEDRRYKPHVTLARKVKAAGNVEPTGGASWQVQDFVLVESHTDGRVPSYVPVARFRLGK